MRLRAYHAEHGRLGARPTDHNALPLRLISAMRARGTACIYAILRFFGFEFVQFSHETDVVLGRKPVAIIGGHRFFRLELRA